MGAAKKLIDKKVLRDLVPINALSAAHIEEITRKAVIEEVRAGRYLFRSGDRDYQSVYLLQGSIELLGNGREVVSTVHAGSEAALHPLAHKQPRQLSARASGKVTVARVDSSLLDVLLTWDESAGYDVVEIDAQDDDDWMTRMLQSQAFLQLPPANIHQLLMRLESITARAGETIVRQDEEGDFFYIVKSGRLAVTRKPSARAKEVLLAELGEGACFGEDALVSGTRRNASVTMVTDGSLMRLSKEDFNELLREPLVKEIAFPEAQQLAAGGAQWLDVRLPGEFGNQAIKGSINLPLSALREQCAALDAGISYLVCCDTGRRSSTGAFLLSQQGLDVHVLKNGLAEVPDDMLTGERTAAATETDAEIIPFEPDGAAGQDLPADEAGNHNGSAADSVLIDKIAAVENEKIALQQQLDEAGKRLRTAEARLEEFQGRHQDGQSAVTRQLERQQQEHQEQLREHEQELDRVRDDYQQLGQRTSAVAGERDAAIRELEEVRQRLSALQEQQDARQSGIGAELDAAQEALQEEQRRHSALQQQYTELETRNRELEQQQGEVAGQAESSQRRNAELETKLAAVERERKEYEQSLQQAAEREQHLQQQLEQAQQRAADELEQVRAGLSAERDELNSQLEAVQAQLDAAAEREQQEEERAKQVQQELQQAHSEREDVLLQLEQANTQAAEAEKRAQELDARLQAADSEHQSEINGAREAMVRAQGERDNVQREHRRLLETLRKAERDLERARHDHETEVLRLQKELKSAAGDSSAALGAELEALQSQIRDGERLRDDLEIKLGERSAQLENEQAESEKLARQLEQARQSASEAEQQLLETNQAANEEMAVRLDKELQAQQALREQLATVSAERNESREQLTVQNQELEELREALRSAQAGSEDAAGRLQPLQERVQQLEQALAGKQQAEQQARKEIDQLRAEAEVTRSLVDMQATTDSAGVPDEELEQARQNVEVAVRLRTQAEQQVQALQREVEQLQAQLEQAGSGASAGVQGGHIPSLDENDPDASALLVPDIEIPEPGPGEQEPAAALLVEEDDRPGSHIEAGRSGGWKGLLAGLVAGAVLATGAWWLTGSQPVSPGAGAQATAPTVVGDEDTESTGDAEQERLEAGSRSPATAPPIAVPAAAARVPEKIPAIARGTSVVPAQAVQPPAEESPPQAEPVAEEVRKEAITAGTEPVQPRVRQPAGTFRDTLSDGSKGPLMVSLRSDRFVMGSDASSAEFDERPQHPVRLAHFAISKNEVTFAQYDRFAQATGRRRPSDQGWGRASRPVINVSWQDAVAYTQWLSSQTGQYYRLPSESEWEFAARSGSKRRFWWGNEVGENHANCFDCGGRWSGTRTAPAGSFAASAFGLHDMAGNVMEWVQDCYVAGYADAPADGAAVLGGDCSSRVVRGGSYSSPADLLRSASRDQRPPDTRLDNLGFRVVRQGL